MRKKVIIIGAGIGGLSTALRLLKNGYEVEIYEKNDKIGGRVNIIETDTFRFDLSASILMMPDTYKEIFTYLNKNYKDYLEFIEIEPTYRLFSSNGTSIDFNNNFSSLTKNLEEISKEDSLGTLPENPSLYIYCPSRIDRSMIINEGDCLNIMLRVPNLFFDKIIWDEHTINLLSDKILKELKNIKGLEDLEEIFNIKITLLH